MKSIDQLCHLHQTCPCYKTLHYYLRKWPTPLCKFIHSIHQLQSDYAIYWSSVIYIIILKEQVHQINQSAISFTSDLSMLSDSTLTFSKMPHPTVQIHTFHRSAENGFYWLYTIICIRPVHAIRLYTNILENAPPHCANPYIPSISCKRILLIIHYHLH